MSLVFNNNSTIENITFNGNDVEHLVYNGVEVWTKTPVDYSVIPMTFQILTDGRINLTQQGTSSSTNYQYQYSLNGGSWTTITGGSGVNVVSGDTLAVRNNNSSGSTPNSNSGYFIFSTTCNFNLYGNAASWYSSNFSTKNLSTSYLFYDLFMNCTGLKSAKNLIIPISSSIANRMFYQMFKGCSNLEYPPQIKTSSSYSYSTVSTYGLYGCFQDCTNLKYTPTINFGNISQQGCIYMFSECTNLTDNYITFNNCDRIYEYGCYDMYYNCKKLVNLHGLTTLHASRVDTYGCYRMFRYCGFEVAPDLPATTINTYCYFTMFNGCSKLKTAPAILPATTLYQNCYRTMFSNCTNLENAPELPATSLATSCYHYLFNGCSKINYIKCGATSNINTTNCSNWVNGVSATGTFVKKTSATWGSGISAIPSGWTVQNY